MCIVIGIGTRKGGTGKTSICIELATIFGMRGYRTLVIDLDPNLNFSLSSKADLRKPNIYNVLTSENPLEDAVQSTKYYDFIPSTQKLILIERDFNEENIFLLSEIIKGANYDIVLIDNGGQAGRLPLMSIIATDYYIIVTDSDSNALHGVKFISNDIISTNERLKDKHRTQILGVVFNKYETTNNHKRALEKLNMICREKNTRMFKTLIRKSTAAPASKEFDLSVTEFLPKKNTLRADYQNLADEILDRIKGA